ncbi:hypothetical protein ElyMa_006814100 [Elysia marginata]|uniref:Uncharacterized protein n=1 Tax=Elysia marginata TaxID=1093978 RepID=A0AAV4J2W8_9GAST|nr:hypothetical protein ElyMa_006814100 [Elysia marginata]
MPTTSRKRPSKNTCFTVFPLRSGFVDVCVIEWKALSFASAQSDWLALPNTQLEREEKTEGGGSGRPTSKTRSCPRFSKRVYRGPKLERIRGKHGDCGVLLWTNRKALLPVNERDRAPRLGWPAPAMNQ